MVKIEADAIAAALQPEGFRKQEGSDEIAFVRPSKLPGIFHVVECMYSGKHEEMYSGKHEEILFLTVALSAVQHQALRFRGLFARDGWPELDSDRENGRVCLQSAGDVAAWLRRLADLAPERFERLTRERAVPLVLATDEARKNAERWIAALEGPQFEQILRAPFRDLTEEQTKLVDAVLRRPFALASPGLRNAHELAIATMVRGQDPTIIRLATAPTPLNRLTRLTSVPNEAVWRIRLLVDRVLTLAESVHGSSGQKE
jgi:hypothetical protein